MPKPGPWMNVSDDSDERSDPVSPSELWVASIANRSANPDQPPMMWAVAANMIPMSGDVIGGRAHTADDARTAADRALQRLGWDTPDDGWWHERIVGETPAKDGAK